MLKLLPGIADHGNSHKNCSPGGKCKEYMERINQRIKLIETNIQRKAEQNTVEELQKKVEDIENKI